MWSTGGGGIGDWWDIGFWKWSNYCKDFFRIADLGGTIETIQKKNSESDFGRKILGVPINPISWLFRLLFEEVNHLSSERYMLGSPKTYLGLHISCLFLSRGKICSVMTGGAGASALGVLWAFNNIHSVFLALGSHNRPMLISRRAQRGESLRIWWGPQKHADLPGKERGWKEATLGSLGSGVSAHCRHAHPEAPYCTVCGSSHSPSPSLTHPLGQWLEGSLSSHQLDEEHSPAPGVQQGSSCCRLNLEL